MAFADSDTVKQITDHIGLIDEYLEQLGAAVPEELREKIAQMKKLLLESRPPALAFVGRRGAGKSSLVNAIFGEPVAKKGAVVSQTRFRWHEYEGENGTLNILDTRGVQEGSTPEEGGEATGPVADILLQFSKVPPDVLVFLVKATEVDAAIDGDLDALEAILIGLEKAHGKVALPPIVAVCTRCDGLEPARTPLHDPDRAHPEDLAEKLRHVQEAEEHLENKMRSRARVDAQLTAVVGVSALIEWRPSDGSLRTDERWRIDRLVELIYDTVPDEARMELARLGRVRALQKDISRQITKLAAGVCGGIAATPIPVGDMAPITSIQVMLVTMIAYVSGRTASIATVMEFMGALGINIGAGYAAREISRTIIKFIFPGGGLIISSGIAFATTMAIGEAAIAYFIEDVSDDDTKQLFSANAKQIADQAEGEPEAAAADDEIVDAEFVEIAPENTEES